MMRLQYAPFHAALGCAACCFALATTSASAYVPSAAHSGSCSISGIARVRAQTGPWPNIQRHAPIVRRTTPDEIVRTALSFRGARYRFGGDSSTSGFDCSGFVQAVCAKWGVYLPRLAREQLLKSKGKRVFIYELQPGDLVFFSDTYRRGTSHVGIYVGDGKMIHAATRAQGVIVSDLTESYLRQHYCGAIRLDLSTLPPARAEAK